ncbi:MAG: hypothetical protein WBW62_10970, partial [Solirubrobacterales bacterium]
EQLDVSVSFGSAAGLAGAFESRKVPAGTRTVRLRMPRVAPRQKIPLKLKVQLKDASGVKFKVTRRVTLPPVKKKFRR